MSRLRVLHLTVSDRGGAGVACLRLHRALRDLDVDSRVVVSRRAETDGTVIQNGTRWTAALRFRLDRLPLKLYGQKHVFAWWSVNWVPHIPRTRFHDWTPDIIHAHWIGDGFVSLDRLAKLGKPIVWTMHDMWPFTGGCHYAWDCIRYEQECGACPQLGSKTTEDLSSRSLARRAEAWKAMRAVGVSPSPWLAKVARQSAVLQHGRVEVIPNGLDGGLFTPGRREEARRHFGVQENERVLLVGSVEAVKDKRKGFDLLVEALAKCKAGGNTEQWRVLVFGADSGPGQETIGMPVSYCGTVTEERRMSQIYQAADVYTLPSLQDNLPNTVVEAMACGTPVVAFRAAGLADMIRDGVTGRLAQPFSTDSLATAIRDAMTSAGERWRQACRKEFERVYAWPGPAYQYLELYKELLNS